MAKPDMPEDKVKEYYDKRLKQFSDTETLAFSENNVCDQGKKEKMNNENNQPPSGAAGPEPPPSPSLEDTNGTTGQDYKIINDPIHGHIQLESILIRIIDAPQFQRLRDIKQLGCTYRVFPGASHNRFEHAIGVCHLAGEFVHVLMQLRSDIIHPKDALCVKIAALCYNLGYGPFSHAFNQMCKQKFPEWNVEEASVVMFRHLVRENRLEVPLKDKGIEEEEMKMIEALMNPKAGIPHERRDVLSFLRKVVRDPHTSIDAVTMDSIARDSYLLNLPCNFDHKRLVKFVRLNKVRGQYILCYREKEAQDLYAMFMSKLSLQTRAYKHKTVQILEHMLEQALAKADDALHLTEIARLLLRGDEEQQTEAARKYTHLTDYVIHRIMESTDESLNESQLLLKNIETRNLKKFIGTVQMKPDGQCRQLDRFLTEAKESEEMVDVMKECDMLRVEFRFGSKTCENPVEDVYFYYKSDVTSPVTIKRAQVSKILPEVFTEFVLRVYHTRVNDDETYKTVERQFQDLVNKPWHEGLKWVSMYTHRIQSPSLLPSTEESAIAENSST